MLVPLLILVLIGSVGLFAALRPEEYTRYFLAESQRKALFGNLKAVSSLGWAVFCACVAVFTAIWFHREWNILAPLLGPLFFLVCAGAYAWWGIRLLRDPELFRKRLSGFWSQLPAWVVRGLSSLLLLGTLAFLYGFLLKSRLLLR